MLHCAVALVSLRLYFKFKRLPQVNYNLMAVNAFMAMTGLYQLSRKIRQDYGTQLGLGPGEEKNTSP